MKQNKSARGGSKIRSMRPSPRVPERNCDGVYCNNYFMHAATSHVGNLVKVETVQGILYEGIFKTFSEHFEVVLELAHKVDTANPQKVNVHEVVDIMIIHPKDIVYICAQNTEPDFAVKSGTFQTDSNISKYNGDITGEKKLTPWEGPPVCNGEECDLEASDTNQNGWDVHDMFLKNEQFGVQTSYDDSLSDYTCQIRKDTKDYRDDEAKAARIAMEIERNPSSLARANLENGENEEDTFAAVTRPETDNDKYVPPMKRKVSQHHRGAEGGNRGGVGGGSGGGSRGQYSTNVREDQINELKKFGSDFNLTSSSSSYDMKNKEQNEAPKQIQVVTSRNKSPPVSQQQGPIGASERNVVPVTIVPTLPPQGGKYANVAVPAAGAHAHQQPVTTAPPPPPHAVPPQPTPVPLTSLPVVKHPAHLMPPFQPVPAHQQPPLHLQQRGDAPPVMIQHPGMPPPHLAPPMHHPQQSILGAKPLSAAVQHKPGVPPPLHQGGPPPPTSALAAQAQAPPMQQPPPTVAQQTKTVISTQMMQPGGPQQPSPNSLAATTQQQPPPAGGVHHSQQRSPMQQQSSASKGQHQTTTTSAATATTQSNSQPSATAQTDANAAGQHETDGPTKMTKDDEDSLDEVSTTLKKSTLNPNAKEFVYNPTPKSYTPVSRSPSTPTQSRPHTPQTPNNYNIHPANAPVAAGIQMMMPTYVVASPASYVPQPPTSNRLRKMPVNSHRTPEFHPSNIPVSAVTGQPLLAPSITVAPSPLGHGTSFPVPAYPHHPQLAAQHYPLQMLRMVQQGSVVPFVPSSIGYHETAGSNAATAVYVNHGSGAAMAMAPHTPHVHHAPQPHPPPSTAPSPSHTPNSYQHPSLATQNAPPYQSIMCPVIQAPPNHGPPHQMVAAQAQAHSMQQYIQHQQAQQPHIQVSLIPHTS